MVMVSSSLIVTLLIVFSVDITHVVLWGWRRFFGILFLERLFICHTFYLFFSCRDCCGDGSGSSEFSFESGSFLLAPWQGGENSLKSNSEVGEMFLWRRTVSYQSDQSKSISPLSGERVAHYSRSLCSSCSSQIPLGNSSC